MGGGGWWRVPTVAGVEDSCRGIAKARARALNIEFVAEGAAPGIDSCLLVWYVGVVGRSFAKAHRRRDAVWNWPREGRTRVRRSMFGNDNVWSVKRGLPAGASPPSPSKGCFSRSLPSFPKAEFRSTADWPKTSETEPAHSVVVKNLPSQTAESDIHALFSQLGDIHTIVSSERKRLGLIIVHFFDVRSAEDVRRRFNGRTLQKCVIKVSFLQLEPGLSASFLPRYPYPLGGVVLLKNLPPFLTKERLRTFCELYGSVSHVDPDTSMVIYYDVREAYDAIQKLNNGDVNLSGEIVSARAAYDSSGKLAKGETSAPKEGTQRRSQPSFSQSMSSFPIVDGHDERNLAGKPSEADYTKTAAHPQSMNRLAVSPPTAPTHSTMLPHSPATVPTAAQPSSSSVESIAEAIVATMGHQQKLLLDLQAALIHEMTNGSPNVVDTQTRMNAAHEMLNDVIKQNMGFQNTFIKKGRGTADTSLSALAKPFSPPGNSSMTSMLRNGSTVPLQPQHSPPAADDVSVSLGARGARTQDRRGHENGTTGAGGKSRRKRDPRSGNDFIIDIDAILSKRDRRTTVMMQNIPNNYSQRMLLDEINTNFDGTYDFFYLPMDYKNKCNIGYAFINFLHSETIAQFFTEFNNRHWSVFKSNKICAIKYGRIQGKPGLISHFKKTNVVRDAPEDYRPLLFYSSGSHAGETEPFL
eukprot:Stramenopile-MAST_4_protein_667